MLDAADFSAQSRKRLFWTNIPNVSQPLEKSNELLKDIVEPFENVDKKYWYNYDYEFNGEDANPICTLKINCFKMGKRVSNLNSKCYTLTCVNGGYTHKKVYQDGRNRKMTPIEYERCQSLPDNYTKFGLQNGKVITLSDTPRYNGCGNGWNANVIKHILKNLLTD
jgi:DNA (cytosine-5)-methyltransferase 3A